MEAVFLKTNRYQPFSYRKKVSPESEETNACYIGIILPLPIDYHVHRKVTVKKLEDSNQVNSILVELFVIPVPLNGHDRTKDFFWKDEFIIDGEYLQDIDIENIDIDIKVMSLHIDPGIPYIDVPTERNIEYVTIDPKDWKIDSNNWHVGSISIADIEETTSNESDSIVDSDHIENLTLPERITPVVRGLEGESDEENPDTEEKSKELGTGTPTKGSSTDKKSIKFIRRKI